VNLPATRTHAELEAVVERGLSTFVDVGNALMEIRDGRTYRETHGDFDSYCRERWGLSARRANQQITAARVVGDVSSVGTMVPTNERQARELAAVPALERAEVWQAAAQRAAAEERPVTAADVRAVATPSAAPEASPEQVAASQPHMLGHKAIERTQDVVRIVEAAGGVDEVMAALDASPLGSATRESWIYFVAKAHDLLGEWRQRLEEKPALRRVK